MMFGLQNKLQRAHFDSRARGVLSTRPVALTDGAAVHVVTQLRHKDVLMYLVAAKSFLGHLEIGRITVLNDGTLTEADQHLLRIHIPGLEIRPIANFRSLHCPTGGTWERLLAIAEYSSENYVIQLDSDTVTLGPVAEVSVAAVTATSFSIGTWDNQQIEPMIQRALDARELNAPQISHVQVIAEKFFDRIEGAASLRYVRGCSGFSGFAPGSVRREFIEDFSSRMTTLIGSKWAEWGSEQVMSNVVVANSPKVTVLPHPKYCDCNNISQAATFVHFIGSCRFSGGSYARLSRAAIARMGAAA